jgi:hypothetical protein
MLLLLVGMAWVSLFLHFRYFSNHQLWNHKLHLGFCNTLLMISWSSCTAFRRSHPAYHQGILTSRCCPGMCPRGWVFVSFLNLSIDTTWPGRCQTELWWYQQRLEASGDEMSMLLVMCMHMCLRCTELVLHICACKKGQLICFYLLESSE